MEQSPQNFAPITDRMTLAGHARATLVLGLPLIGSHLAQMALHVTDTVLLGWYGVHELAAVVLGSSMFYVIFVFGSGFAQAVMPMVAQSMGRGDEGQVRRDTRMGLWLSMGFGLLTYPLFWWSEPLLLGLGQEADVARLGQDFLRLAGLGMIPALMVMAIKGYLAALERTQVVLWVTLAAVLVNAALGYALIFGHWGAPEMGVRGAGLASLTVQILTAGLLLAYAGWLPALRRFHLLQRFWRMDRGALASVFRMGWPIGVTALAESGLFSATAIMMGWIGAIPLAAHGIALEVTSLTFMAHLGLSNAATVRAGRAHGAGDAQGLRDGAKAAIGLSVLIGLVNIVLMVVFATPIIGVFLDMAKPASGDILAYGVMLLMFAALFQMADAMQVMALGLLRGMHDTRVPMIMATVSYWIIGMPAGYLLGFTLGLGGGGLWLGLVIGLTFAAVTMMWRFWRRA